MNKTFCKDAVTVAELEKAIKIFGSKVQSEAVDDVHRATKQVAATKLKQAIFCAVSANAGQRAGPVAEARKQLAPAKKWKVNSYTRKPSISKLI